MNGSTPFTALAILSHIIATLFSISLLLIISNNTYCLPIEYRPKIANNKILLYSYGALIAFGLSDVANVLRLSDIGALNHNEIAYYVLYESCLYLWRLGQICVYMLFIMRMKYSFSATKYQSPTWHFILLYSMMFIFFLLQIALSIEKYIFFDAFGIVSSSFNSIFEESNIWCTEVVDLMISISLLYLFYSKLIRLNIDIVGSMTSIKYGQSATNTPDSGFLLLSKQESIISIMSKQTILSSVVIIVSQLFCILIGVGYVFCPGNNSDVNLRNQTKCMKYWRDGWRCYWALVSIINNLCVFLSFDFLASSYYKLCGLCDHWCRSCMERTFNKQNQPFIGYDIQNIESKQVLLDIALSVSTNGTQAPMIRNSNTDMTFHHAMIGTASSI